MEEPTNEQIQNILGLLYDSTEHEECRFFSGIIKYFRKQPEGLLDTIDDYSNRLEDEIRVERSILYENMKISRDQERIKVFLLLSKVKLNHYKDNRNLAKSANDYFAKNKFEYRIPGEMIDQLPNIVKACHKAFGALHAIELIIRRDGISLIKEYVNKYLDYEEYVLKNIINQVRNTDEEMGKKALDPDAMIEAAKKTLKPLGYMDIALEKKDPLDLADMMWREMLAAESVLRFRKSSNPFNFTDEEQLDNAICDTLIAHDLC